MYTKTCYRGKKQNSTQKKHLTMTAVESQQTLQEGPWIEITTNNISETGRIQRSVRHRI